jgi:hypothetical protein
MSIDPQTWERDDRPVLPWRDLQRIGLAEGQRSYGRLEARLSTLRLFQPALVPGLLQTPEYMRAVLRRYADSEDTLASAIEGRLQRQQVLDDLSKELRFVITEPALRWRLLTPALMAAQLDRIIAVSRLANVDIRIVPLQAEQHDVASHGFAIHDEHRVDVEAVHAGLTITDPRDVELYIEKFTGFESSALSGEAMDELVESIRDGFRQEGQMI